MFVGWFGVVWFGKVSLEKGINANILNKWY